MEDTRTRTDRSQSELIAVVLLVGMVSVSSVLLLVVGGVAVGDSEQRAETMRVEQSFRHLDAEVDTVAYERSGSRTTNLALRDRGEGVVERSEDGRVVVTVDGPSGKKEVLNSSTGAIVYRDGETTIGYQSTGVWRGTGNETQMVSAPGVEYERKPGEPTLKIPVTRVDGGLDGTTGRISVHQGPPGSGQNDARWVSYSAITIRVESEFYVGWADYFRSVLPGGVYVDHENETVVVRVFPSSMSGGIPGGVIQTTAGETLKFSQTFGTDAYNSTEGPYGVSQTPDGRVIAEGDVVVENKAEIHGPVVAGGDVRLGQQTLIDDDATAGGDLVLDNGGSVAGDTRVGNNLTFRSHKSAIGGDARYGTLVNDTNKKVDVGGSMTRTATPPATDLTDFPAVDGVIDSMREATIQANDNDAGASAVSGTTLDRSGCSNACTFTLTAGQYHLSKVELRTDETLVFDAREGPIDLVVDGPFQAHLADVVVKGDGRVRIFVDSEDPSRDDLLLDRTSVSVPGDRSPQFWIYMDHDANAVIEGGVGTTPKVDGVVFGPANGAGDGTEIEVRTYAEVFGAVIGDVDAITQGAEVHFDRALLERRSKAGGMPPVKWLHLFVREVVVEQG